MSKQRGGRVALKGQWSRRSAAFAVLLWLTGCQQSTPTATETVDTRPISVHYVNVSRLPVHTKPDDASPVVTTYRARESVSVLSTNGDWAEVRTGMGSGWVRRKDLATAEETHEKDNPSGRFRVRPEPVTERGARGEIVLEAEVNTDGEVTAVRTLSNTTGSRALELQNSLALKEAQFHPIVIRGRRKPFVYEYRVHY